jgi:hypothetical protein
MNSGSDYCVFTHDLAEECLPYHVYVKEIIARPISAHATNPVLVIPAKPYGKIGGTKIKPMAHQHMSIE